MNILLFSDMHLFTVKNCLVPLAVVAHAFSLRTQETEADGVWGHPGLQIEFQDKPKVEKPCLRNQKLKQTEKIHNKYF